MNKTKKKKNAFRSLRQFEEECFPKSFEKRTAEKPTDAKVLGARLAKESLERIRRRLAK